MNHDRLCAEALRVYHRYATEVIEPLGLCPWARRARLDGKVTHRVMLDPLPRPEDVLPLLDEVTLDPQFEIGLVLFPTLMIDAPEFRRFVASLRTADDARRQGALPPLLMADFHPAVALDKGSPARLISFIRRTPDPTIQLVRRTVLDAVRKNDPGDKIYASAEDIALGRLPDRPAAPLHMRIADQNHATVEEYGFERLSALLDDILRDRNQAYAELGMAPRSWPGQ